MKTLKNIFLLFLGLLALVSCLSWHGTSSDGIRVNNPKVFQYNKSRYTNRSNGAIDTNAVYMLVYSSNYNSEQNDKSYRTAFVRFFNSGQVLFYYGDSEPTLKEINDPLIGIPGYYIVKGHKLKISMFQGINGGQIGKFYGRILDSGNIKFFGQRPETHFGIYSCTEKDSESRYSIWQKTQINGIIDYKPDW